MTVFRYLGTFIYQFSGDIVSLELSVLALLTLSVVPHSQFL